MFVKPSMQYCKQRLSKLRSNLWFDRVYAWAAAIVVVMAAHADLEVAAYLFAMFVLVAVVSNQSARKD